MFQFESIETPLLHSLSQNSFSQYTTMAPAAVDVILSHSFMKYALNPSTVQQNKHQYASTTTLKQLILDTLFYALLNLIYFHHVNPV